MYCFFRRCFCGVRFDSLNAKVAHQSGCASYAQTVQKVEQIRRSEGTVATARRAAAQAAAAAALASREETDASRALSNAQEQFADSLIPKELIPPPSSSTSMRPTSSVLSPSPLSQVKPELDPSMPNVRTSSHGQSHSHIASHTHSSDILAFANEGMSHSSSAALAINVAPYSSSSFKQMSSQAPLSPVEGGYPFSESKQPTPDHINLFSQTTSHTADPNIISHTAQAQAAISSSTLYSNAAPSASLDTTAQSNEDIKPGDCPTLSLSERIEQHARAGNGDIPISAGSTGLLNLSATAVARNPRRPAGPQASAQQMPTTVSSTPGSSTGMEGAVARGTFIYWQFSCRKSFIINGGCVKFFL